MIKVTALTLQRVDHIHRDNGAASTVLRIHDGIGHQLLDEVVNGPTNFIVRESSQSLHASTTSDATHRRGSERLRGGLGWRSTLRGRLRRLG